MHQEKALEIVNWSAIFPWVTKEMEIFPQESVLVYASFHGIIYNSNSIPKNKAPKSYEDLIDPALVADLGGKDGDSRLHPLVGSGVADLGQRKGFGFCAQARAVWSEAVCARERRSGSSAVSSRSWRAQAGRWKRCGNGRLRARLSWVYPARHRRRCSYYQLAVPKNSVHPNMAKLLIALMVTRDGQSVLEKHDMRSSYLVDGTLMAKYVKANKLKLQDPRELNEVFQKADTSLDEELTKILLK